MIDSRETFERIADQLTRKLRALKDARIALNSVLNFDNAAELAKPIYGERGTNVITAIGAALDDAETMSVTIDGVTEYIDDRFETWEEMFSALRNTIHAIDDELAANEDIIRGLGEDGVAAMAQRIASEANEREIAAADRYNDYMKEGIA